MDEATRHRIEDLLSKNHVVLFMKGSRMFPQCGFSAQLVDLLKRRGVSFKDVNVLLDDELRQGIKEHASWPTIPQLYIAGQFVGGCDIVVELDANGELEELLKPKP